MTQSALATEAANLWGGRVTRLLRDRENAVFEIALPKGRAALRLHRQGYQNPETIASELWWCAALAGLGVAVPAALPARDGQLLQLLSTGRLASVMDWVEGEALGEAGVPLAYPAAEITAKHHALGRLLADLHRATDSLTLPPQFHRPGWDVAGLVGEAPLWSRFWDHPGATPRQTALLQAARALLHSGLTSYAKTGNFGLIHADVLRENILVNKDSLTLIDFDDSGFGFRPYDLGTALSQNLNEPAYAEIRAAMIEGYGDAGITPALADLFTLARCCASVGWAATRLPPDHPVQASHLARACDLAGALL